jgi:hypothetical protein
MSKPISDQANKLWQIIIAPNTADSYKQALGVTWTILKEAALLIWLVLCLVLVVFDWFWDNSIAAGQNTRAWFSRFTSDDTSQVASEMGKGLLAAGKTSLDYVVAQAREQVGLPAKASIATAPAAISPTQPKPGNSPDTRSQTTGAQTINPEIVEPLVVEPQATEPKRSATDVE